MRVKPSKENIISLSVFSFLLDRGGKEEDEEQKINFFLSSALPLFLPLSGSWRQASLLPEQATYEYVACMQYASDIPGTARKRLNRWNCLQEKERESHLKPKNETFGLLLFLS